MDIEIGDYLTIDWGEAVIKNTKSKSKKKVKESKTPSSSKTIGKITTEKEIEAKLKKLNAIQEDELPEF